MKPISPTLLTFLTELGAGATFAEYDLYTITLFGGGVLRFTNCQVDVGWLGTTWSSKGVRVDPQSKRARAHWKIGLDVDTWSVTVMPRARDDVTGDDYPDTILGTPWVAAAAAGALDGAQIQVDRAYFADAPTYPLAAGVATPIGILTVFAGVVGAVDIGDIDVSINAMDHRSLLSANLPNRLYRASCRHTLFDAGCALLASNFDVAGLVGPGSTRNQIVSTIAAPGGSGTYALGRIVMTSGLNSTFARAVRSWDAGVLKLLMPLPFDVEVGDTFTAYPGCDKTQVACNLFSNIANYGGAPYIPAPETAV